MLVIHPLSFCGKHAYDSPVTYRVMKTTQPFGQQSKSPAKTRCFTSHLEQLHEPSQCETRRKTLPAPRMQVLARG